MLRHRLLKVFQSSLKNVGQETVIRNGCVCLQSQRDYASLGEAIQYIRFKYFNTIRHHLDHDKWCKIFSVEGNIGAGKHDFGKELASKLDLKFFPQATPDYHITKHRGQYPDELLEWWFHPESVYRKANTFSLDYFTQDPSDLVHTFKYQTMMQVNRYLHYCDALAYLLRTGRGVTIIRNYFSDRVFAMAIKEMGWMSNKYWDHYELCYDTSNAVILHPQVIIYLDIPAQECYEKVQETGNEVDKRLPLEFYKQIEKTYRNIYLPYAKERGVNVISLPWSEPLPINQVIEKLDEEPNLNAANSVWNRKVTEQLKKIRRLCEDSFLRTTVFRHYVADDEVWYDDSVRYALETELRAIPYRYPKGLNACLGDKYIFFKNM